MKSVNKDRKHISWWKIPLAFLAFAALTVGGYVAYVFGTYSRIQDRKELKINKHGKEVLKTGQEYSAVTYNIGFGAYTADYTFFMDEGKESRARSRESVEKCTDETAKNALSLDPDIALFQEVDTDSDRSWHVNQVHQIEDTFARKGDYDSIFASNYHSAYLMYPPTSPIGASNSGILTLSRFPVTSALRRSLPIATGFKKILDLDRCYSIHRIPTEDGKELVLINVHLSAYGTDASQGNAQLDMIFEDMKVELDKGNYVICGGDFNHDFTVNSKEYFNPGTDKDYTWCQPFPDQILPEGFSKCTDYAEGMVHTTRYNNIPYGKDSFVVILDGFILSDNIKCTYVQNIDTGYLYSDHNPVLMKFILDNN